MLDPTMSIRATTSRLLPGRTPATSAAGYDFAAPHYDDWAWQSFWRANEFPIIFALLMRAEPRRGVLDVGVGTGAFLADVARAVRDVPIAGVDVSQGMLQLARARLGSRALLVQGDVQRGLPFKSNSFDAVVAMRVVNHLSDFDRGLAEIGRVLAPGGTLIATDLADEFDYDCTRIPTPEGSVSIETYKHSQTDWQCALEAARFSAPDVQSYRFSKLGDPRAGGLQHKINRDTPIFQIIMARKHTD
jgi:ubiquinone/menaquinone biosynthesis C-methylase UbiE